MAPQPTEPRHDRTLDGSSRGPHGGSVVQSGDPIQELCTRPFIPAVSRTHVGPQGVQVPNAYQDIESVPVGQVVAIGVREGVEFSAGTAEPSPLPQVG